MAKRKPITPDSSAGIRDQQYEIVSIAAIQPHPRNPRQGDVNAIIASIKANQFFGACIVQRSTGNILAGNHRWLAARECGLAGVPVIWVDCNDAEALRILLVDNRTNDLAGYDDAALAQLLQEVQAEAGTLLGTGFDLEALDELLAGIASSTASEAITADDAVPEPKANPVTRPGDLWLLGSRVICPHCGTENDV
jgi:ParB-like chromosome segregation protein Spo0J